MNTKEQSYMFLILKKIDKLKHEDMFQLQDHQVTRDNGMKITGERFGKGVI